MGNFLSAAPLMVAHLQQQIQSVPSLNIRPAVSLEWAVKNALSPSVNVIFFDDVPDVGDGGSRGRGKVQTSSQFWLILLSMRNVADAGTSAQLDAGELIVAALTALQGLSLSDQHQPLHRQRCPFRKTDKDGFTHFPFMFSTKIITGANHG
jgi:hypothetical protein